MPELQLHIALTPAEFVRKCTPAELRELSGLLNRTHYQASMKAAEYIEIDPENDEAGQQAIDAIKKNFE